MDDPPSTPQRKDKRKHPEPVNTSAPPSRSKMDLVHDALMAPFGGTSTHRKRNSTRILEDRMFSFGLQVKLYFTNVSLVAPVILTPRMMTHTSTVASRNSSNRQQLAAPSNASLDFATLGRAPMRLSLSRRITSGDLQIVEATDELLHEDIPDAESGVSLLKGFNATIPSSENNKTRRRQLRHVDVGPRTGKSRGLLRGREDEDAESVVSDDDLVLVDPSRRRGKNKGRRKRESLSAAKFLGKEELKRQSQEIVRDKENLHVRRVSHYTFNSCSRYLYQWSESH